MVRLGTLLIVLIALAFPSTAHSETYAGQEPPPHVVLQLVDDGLAWWNARGVQNPVCDGRSPRAWVAPTLPTADGNGAWGLGLSQTCELWLSGWLSDVLTGPFSFERAAQGCQAVYHEVGHALGLPHAQSGVMAGSGDWGAPDPEPRPLAWAPAPCLRWARGQWIDRLKSLGVTDSELRSERRATALTIKHAITP